MDAQTGLTDDLEAVARGLKRLDQVKGDRRRELVRAALRLREADPGLDRDSRSRMRQRVLSGLPGRRRRSGLDWLLPVLSVLAAPGPYFLRFIGVAFVVSALLGAATVASADSLPDEPLYSLKLAAEEFRLVVATTPEDRATVHLSIAEHRLTEAGRLAEIGRDNAAIVATSEYGKQLAHAAAELAIVEAVNPRTDALIDQLQQRLVAQQEGVSSTAARLAADPARGEVALVLAAVSATASPGPDPADTPASRIAANGAAVASKVAEVAVSRVASPEPIDVDDAAPTPTPAPTTRSAAPPGVGAVAARPEVTRTPERSAAPSRTPERSASPTRTASPKPTATQKQRTEAETRAEERVREAAEKAKKAAEEARRAAERAKKAAEKTPKPAATARPIATRR